jgi:predicted GIY-YIG superfamily endonuclease
MAELSTPVIRDCCVYIFARKDIKRLEGDSIRFDVDVDNYKYLYVGLTNNFKRRLSEHLACVLDLEYKTSQKFYNSVRAHGWENYEKIVVASGLTREEAMAKEIETIAEYRSFELGLNSTPGGDGGPIMFGADNPRAQAVNVYNNKTGDIRSFLWLGDADKALGVSRGTVSGIASQNIDIAQAWSPDWNAYIQAHYVYDKMPFEENMPTPCEKTAHILRKPIIIVNIDTRFEQSFDWSGEAAMHFEINECNIKDVLIGNSKQFNVKTGEFTGRYDAQYRPKTREWDFDILPSIELNAMARSKPIIVMNLDTRIEKKFDQTRDAAAYFLIKQCNIKNVILNPFIHQFTIKNGEYMGRYDAQYLPKTREWNFNILPSYEATALALSEAVIAFDEDGKLIYDFISGQEAMRNTKIQRSHISACATHDRPFAGRTIDKQQLLRWEFKDPEKRILYDNNFPRSSKSNRIFYICPNDTEHIFASQKKAAEETRGEYKLKDQIASIQSSVASCGKKKCKNGKSWSRKTITYDI